MTEKEEKYLKEQIVSLGGLLSIIVVGTGFIFCFSGNQMLNFLIYFIVIMISSLVGGLTYLIAYAMGYISLVIFIIPFILLMAVGFCYPQINVADLERFSAIYTTGFVLGVIICTLWLSRALKIHIVNRNKIEKLSD